MPSFLAQPYFSENKIRLYDKSKPINASSPWWTIDLTADIAAAWGPGSGPNSLVCHKAKLFVSLDLGGRGGVLMYRYADLYPSKKPAATVIKPGGGSGAASIGLAIDRNTDDLYVAVYSLDGGQSGIWRYSASSNYSSGNQFASFADPSIAEICANLAFDASGNLWLSTWSPSNNPAEHFLICYKNLNKNDFYKISNTASKIYSASSLSAGSVNVHLLSAPEGLAFDAAGHLWLANNNDFARTNQAGEGTLVRIDRAWLNTLLASPSTGLGAGNPSYQVPPASARVSYIPSGKLGGLTCDGNQLLINDQGQNQGGDYSLNGVVWSWDGSTPFTSANFKATGLGTTYPGNGQGALMEPLLLIQDNSGDVGAEPNSTTTTAWESQDLWVRQTNDGQSPGNDLSQAVLGGQPSYVYVRVRNRGITPTSSDETLRLYWAKASTGLGWPAPWDGSNNAPPPSNGNPIGSSIPLSFPNGSGSTGILPGQAEIIEIFWNDTPNPKDYTAQFGSDDEHFCLLARLQTSSTPPAGLKEQTGGQNALISNVLNNAKIAWRNIHITRVAAQFKPGVVLVANHARQTSTYAIRFELLNAKGEPEDFERDSLLLIAQGKAKEKLLQTDLNPDAIEKVGEGSWRVLQPERGLENLRLDPGETLPLTLSYTSRNDGENYVIRVRQYAQEAGDSLLVGGQTFVVGTVHGFPVASARAEVTYNKRTLAFWIFLLLVLLTLSLRLYLFLASLP
ncbi:MAG: hypothetical protein VKP70_03705 [Cyanobacteriota bacterium]|nr:hypothetical protein [Cyanobacteriota bacterium]